MVKFVLFLKKIYLLLLFIVLEVLVLNFYANSTNYTKAKMLSVSNTMVGGVYKMFSDITDYFGLRKENDMLVDEIAGLRNQIDYYRSNAALEQGLSDYSLAEYTDDYRQYIYTTAAIVNNSLTRQENYVMIDKGWHDGVEPNMAMITPDGSIVGYILDCSDHLSVGLSVLNINFRTGGKIKNKENFGSVFWDGRDHNFLTLSEIPKYADIAVGDTIVTDYSSIFPTNVVIGLVESYELNQANYYDVKVRLTTPMSTLKNVLLVRYAEIVERMMLEEEYF